MRSKQGISKTWHLISGFPDVLCIYIYIYIHIYIYITLYNMILGKTWKACQVVHLLWMLEATRFLDCQALADGLRQQLLESMEITAEKWEEGGRPGIWGKHEKTMGFSHVFHLIVRIYGDIWGDDTWYFFWGMVGPRGACI